MRGATTAKGGAVLGGLDAHIVCWGVPPTFVRTVRDEAGEPVRVLSSGGVYQSATYLGERRMEPVFEYYRAFGWALDELALEAPRVLAIGGGGCSFPKLVASTHPAARVDVVEIDARVIDAAKRWFFAEEAAERMRTAGGELRFVCADGAAFVRAAALRHERYDFIALDAFSGARPVEALADAAAASGYAAILSDGGAVAANVVTPGGDATFLRDFQTALEAAFAHVELRDASDEAWGTDDNYLLLAKSPLVA